MDELGLFPNTLSSQTQVLFANFGVEAVKVIFPYLNQLRNQSISCELYPIESKLKKQLGYANSKGIQKVILMGSVELEQKSFVLKNMKSGEQTTHPLSSLINILN